MSVRVSASAVQLPVEVVAECLAYDRCVKTDEPAIDRVSLRWPPLRLSRRLAPARAASFMRPVSHLLLSTPVPQGEVSAVLLWSNGAAPHEFVVPVGRTVVSALRWLQWAFWLSAIAAVALLLLTGWVALAVLPPVAYFVFRRYVLWRYCIRGRAWDGFLELRDVSEGFRARAESIVAARVRRDDATRTNPDQPSHTA